MIVTVWSLYNTVRSLFRRSTTRNRVGRDDAGQGSGAAGGAEPTGEERATAIADTLICQAEAAESGPPGSGGIPRDKSRRNPADHSDGARRAR